MKRAIQAFGALVLLAACAAPAPRKPVDPPSRLGAGAVVSRLPVWPSPPAPLDVCITPALYGELVRHDGRTPIAAVAWPEPTLLFHYPVIARDGSVSDTQGTDAEDPELQTCLRRVTASLSLAQAEGGVWNVRLPIELSRTRGLHLVQPALLQLRDQHR